MGRHKKNDIVTDYAIHWEIKDGLYYMTIDLINLYEKEKKSILLQIEITGCKNATDRFLKQVELGMAWLMKESIISMMFVNPDFRNLNILVQNNDIYNYHIKTQDIRMDITFDVKRGEYLSLSLK
ncbi:hypothetical protein [Lunatimonas lonarensis]|nr:hypothetical protein [Lunatimonas lonarensis]